MEAKDAGVGDRGAATVDGILGRYVETPAGRMHYVDEGEGEAILFVHGTPTWSYEWRHVIRALRSSYRCVAPDHLGFGYSDRPSDFAYTPEAHAAQLERFVDGLGLERFTLVVHDFGGPIGLPQALWHAGRVKRLVVMNTWMWSLVDDPAIRRPARLLGGAFGRWLYERANASLRILMPAAWGDRSTLTPEIHRAYLDRFPDAASRGRVLWPLAKSLLGSTAFYDAQWGARESLQGIPSLLVWGMKDRALGARHLERWRSVLPEARVAEMTRSGHWPQETEPDRVIAVLASFLRE